MMRGRLWNPVDQMNGALLGAAAPRGEGVPIGLVGLTVADVPRLLRGLALLASGVETMLVSGRAAGDTVALDPVVTDTVSEEDTVPPRPVARALGRLTGGVAALQDSLSTLSAPLTPGIAVATIRARQAQGAAGQLIQNSGGARRVALVGLLGGGVIAVLLSPLRAWAWGFVRRAWSGTDGQGTITLTQPAQPDASGVPDASDTPDASSASGVSRMSRMSRISARVRQMRPRTPKDTSEVDDATLVDKVESEIFRDPAVPKGRININAERGRVVLRGDMDQPEQISALEAAVRQVAGVKDVENLLHLPGTPAPES